jgi:hypothetical protein
MKNGMVSSYYRSISNEISLWDKLNLIRRFNYWNLSPMLKVFKIEKYAREAKSLIEYGSISTLSAGVLVRFEIKNGVATFDVSPDKGATYLNYSSANTSINLEDDFDEIVDSIATIEAMIRTGFCVTY